MRSPQRPHILLASLLIASASTVDAHAIPPILAAKLIASDGAAGDQMGNAVALSNLAGINGAEPDIAVVGLRYDDSPQADRGSANIYRKNAQGQWVFEAKLVASDGVTSDAFGYSVAIFGDTVVVGAPFDDITLVDQGSAYIFQRNTSGAWSQVTKLVASDAAATDSFGASVAITNTALGGSSFGDLVLVGTPLNDVGTSQDQGSVYVFKRNTSATWVGEGQLAVTGTDAGPLENFGWSVSAYGDRALIGAPFDTIAGGQYRGSSYMWRRSPTGVWTQEAKLVANDGVASDYFGYAVSLFGNQCLIGAPLDDIGSVTDRGSAYVFQLSGTSTWVQEAKLVASDGAAADNFGSFVAIQGNVSICGAPNDDGTVDGSSTSYADVGSAYLFTQTGTATWTQQARITGTVGQAGRVFGNAVAVFGTTGLIGANGEDIGTPLRENQGSASIFNLLPPDCNGNGVPDDEDIASGISRDCNGNGRPDSCDVADGAADVDNDGRLDSCEIAYGDFDLDGNVGGTDLTVILSGWGTANPPTGDLDGNGTIDGIDLTVILGRWGPAP
jgi:hypothetical protein